MARTVGKLNPRTIAGALPPGRYGDGGNLYLIVDAASAKRWVFIFRWQGRQQEMGLGALRDVSLAKARERAAAARAELADGRNPLDQKREAQARPRFGEFVMEFLEAIRPGFSNPKHFAQWKMTLTTYAAPLKDKRLDQITTIDVVATLKPIWTRVPETADRTRQRIERVLDAAEASGHRPPGMRNPASWRGNLQHLLPPRKKLCRGHHPAMPASQVGALLASLRASPSISALALEFTILTACRSGEVRGARWAEIDLATNVWTIPAVRMKARRAHRVPLSPRAREILDEIATFSRGAHVFCVVGTDKPLSGMAMTMLLRGLEDHFIDHDGERRAATTHGFRSTFRDWAGSLTSYPRELAEEALAHQIGNATERA